MRNKKYYRLRAFGILLQPLIFFALSTFFDLAMLYSKSKKTIKQSPDVSIHFEFDPQMKERPYRVFLVRDKELYSIQEWKEPNLFQFYQPGQMTYNFYNIEPGIYWVGFSFKVLQKDWNVIDYEYVDPGISTGIDKQIQNRIEVRKDKQILVDLIIQLLLEKRVEGENDPTGYFKFVERTRPKTPEEEMMLDENYFPLGGGGIFFGVKRKSVKNFEHIKIFFHIHLMDDYPFEDSKPKENK